MTSYTKILVAVDLSREARAVVERARELAEHCGAALSLIHVVDTLVMEGDYELSPELPLQLEETLVKRAEGYLRSLANDMEISDAELIVRVGSVKRKILHFAENHECDLIIIGTHGRHGIATLLGSTANALLHGTKCDVLCVRVSD